MNSLPESIPPSSSVTQQWSALAGMTAGPFFLVVSLVQMPLKEGFNPAEHAFSFLSMGSLGVVQQANFIITGLLFAASALAVRAAVDGRAGAWASTFMVLLGTGKIVAGLFVIDPAFGFPEGAPVGPAPTMSMSSALHGVGFAVSMLSWLLLLAILGRRFHQRGETGWPKACWAFGVALLLVPPLLMGWAAGGTVFLYIVLSSAYLFMTALMSRLKRTALVAT